MRDAGVPLAALVRAGIWLLAQTTPRTLGLYLIDVEGGNGFSKTCAARPGR